ncbi:hypothetical protein QFC24_000836 [Naganishia onofrii]|uniref:Uncharacterized protein n=1 Tax=Naganishia onofrii TaxID=1851511 RepID=A0ACC2XUW8_9TREE|nr:hypothetical protein QFC24_000836 [Naganishia onofrii]
MSTATRLGLNSSSFSLDRNLSLYTIPAVFLTAFLPHTVKALWLGKRFDNSNPRGTLRLHDNDTPWFKDTISRLTAMHQNGMESLPLFFTAVLAGNFARLPARTMSIFSLGYFASRLVFSYIYFTQRTAKGGNMRSLTYLAGVLSSFWIIIKSGNKVYDLV